jgi:hypothetical protein
MLSLLPQNGVNVDLNDLTWRLFQASKEGDVVEVRMLLSREDIDPNLKRACGETPLMVAAENGHEAVARLLLGRRDVTPDSKDSRGRTARSSETPTTSMHPSDRWRPACLGSGLRCSSMLAAPSATPALRHRARG